MSFCGLRTSEVSILIFQSREAVREAGFEVCPSCLDPVASTRVFLPGAPECPSQEEYSVLVIDDDADIREALRESLQEAGFAVVTAAHGQEGLDRLQRIPPPSVIVLDLMMPVMDGHQFTAALREHPALSSLPVIVLTAGQTTPSDVSRVIRKPLRMGELLSAIHEHC
jgi:two-component system response regulator CpxR